MGLPNLFSKKKPDKKNLFILSLITDQSIHSSLWQVFEQKIILLSKSKVRYYNSTEEQLVQMDESLQDLGDRSEETDEILFAFEPSWIKNNKISAEHEKDLKNLTESLSLKPLGFVSTTEAALQHLLKNNSFLSSIVLYIGAQSLDLMIVRQGKVAGSLSVGRSEDIVSDLQEALARLEQNFATNGIKLPPNIILLSAVIDPEKLILYQQQLFSLNWTQDFNFVQKPIIEIITSDQLLDIVTKYYGEVVAKQKGLIPHDAEIDSVQAGSAGLVSAVQFSQMSQPVDSQELADALSSDSINSAQTSPRVPTEQPELEQPDFARKTEATTQSLLKTAQDEEVNNFRPVELEKPDEKQGSSFVEIDTAGKKNKKKKLALKPVIILSVVLGLVISVLVFYFLLKMNYQVEVQIAPQTKNLSKNSVISLSSSVAQSDPVNSLLKAEVITEEVSDKDTIQTTGVKPVGEKAKGLVVIFNKTSEEKTFAKNTILKTEDLEFELDEEITVPAASIEEAKGGEAEMKEFGKKSAKVTAREIGVEGNISQKTDLKIADFSDNTYSARTENDFTGGSSREIRVVADADHKELLANLKQRLLKQAREKLEDNFSQDIYIVPTENYKIVEQKYSDEVGEELENVSLSLTLAVEGLSYTTRDLLTLAKKVLENDIPENYLFIDDSLNVISRIIDDEEDTSQTRLEVEISGKCRAELAEQDFQARLIGVSFDQASSLLREEETIDQVTFSHSPSFSGRFFKFLPNDSNRISIKIKE